MVFWLFPAAPGRSYFHHFWFDRNCESSLISFFFYFEFNYFWTLGFLCTDNIFRLGFHCVVDSCSWAYGVRELEAWGLAAIFHLTSLYDHHLLHLLSRRVQLRKLGSELIYVRINNKKVYLEILILIKIIQKMNSAGKRDIISLLKLYKKARVSHFCNWNKIATFSFCLFFVVRQKLFQIVMFLMLVTRSIILPDILSPRQTYRRIFVLQREPLLTLFFYKSFLK